MGSRLSAEGLCREIERIDAGRKPVEILTDVASLLDHSLSFDATTFTSTDPDTLLPSTAAYITGFPAWACGPYWDAEYLRPDVMTFSDIHLSGATATTLHRETDGAPSRSWRHRDILQKLSLNAELRATFSLGDRCYGMLDLIRGEDEPDFDDADLALVDAATPIIAAKLRRSIITPPRNGDPLPDGTGVIIIDDAGEIASMTPHAREMLELIPEAMTAAPSRRTFLNGIVHAMWARARALAAGGDGPPASSRVTLLDGRRLTLSASSTHHDSGAFGPTVMMLQPTRSSEIGPLMLAAHDLTAREVELVKLLLRGDSAQQISTALGISIHTVRTHVKSIHEKMGVSSRAELTRLFIDEHFLPTADLVVPTGAH